MIGCGSVINSREKEEGAAEEEKEVKKEKRRKLRLNSIFLKVIHDQPQEIS